MIDGQVFAEITGVSSASLQNITFTNPANPNAAAGTPTFSLPSASSGGNSAPVLEDVDDVTFLENTVNTAAQLIDSAVTFTDDSASFGGGSLTVNYAVGGSAEDSLSIRNQGVGVGEIWFDGTTVSYEGTAIGTINGGNNGATGNDLILDFNSDASPEAIDALLQNLTYANSSNTPTATRTISIVVNDASKENDPVTSVITVTAENDAPAHDVPTAQTFNEDTSLTFNAGNGNLISVSDADHTSLTDYTLTVTQGTLTLSQLTGLTFTTGDGTTDATMSFNGTVADINAALDGLIYTPTANYFGADTLSLSTNDGTGVVLGSIGITVTNINDAPTLAAAISDTPAEIGNVFALDITSNFTDLDADTLTYTATQSDLSALPAWLTLDLNTGIFSGTPAGGDAGQVEIDVTVDDGNGTTITTRTYIDVATFTQTGAAANETLTGGVGNDVVHGGDGDDVINASSAADTVFGGDGDDSIDGGTGGDIIFGGSGDDISTGDSGNDELFGSTGNDTFDGGSGADTLTGGAGSDVFLFLDSSHSTDTLIDVITDFTQGSDLIDLRIGFFEIGVNEDQIAVGYDAGNDQTIISSNSSTFSIALTGNINLANSDFIFSNSDGTEISTLTGDDLINGATQVDYINGNSGNDTINGSSQLDILYGGSGNDVLNGDNGNGDRLLGGIGEDILDGGGQRDTLTGGNDNDNFLFSDLTHSVDGSEDLITDFTQGEDIVQLGVGLSGIGVAEDELTISYDAGRVVLWSCEASLSKDVMNAHCFGITLLLAISLQRTNRT